MSKWYGVLPERWVIRRIGAMFRENTESNASLVTRTAMQFRYGEIIRKQINSPDDSYYDSLRRYTVVEANDIMVNGLNLNYDYITQRVAIVKELGCITPAYIALRPNAMINPKFAMYLLKAMDSMKMLNGLGAGIRLTLSFSEFKGVFLPLPPREEQDQIVRFLDWKVSQVNKLIRAKHKQISLLMEQKRSIVNSYINSKRNVSIKIRLKFALSLIVDCPHETPEYSSNGTYYVIRTADQDYGTLRDNQNMYRLEEAEYKKRIRRSPIMKDDIVYGREGERWGLACLVPDDSKYCLGQRMMQLRCNHEILLPQYAVWLLNSEDVYQQGVIDTIGSTSPHVNISTIKNYTIFVPSISEQLEVIDMIQSKLIRIEAIERAENNAIDLLREYRTRLISDVVTGKLDVRDVAVPDYEVVEETTENEPSEDVAEGDDE